MLPPDQVIEQTVNREQKGPGGIIGISTSVGSVQRCVLSSHITATLSSDFKANLGLDTPRSTPKDIGKSRKVFYESATSHCYETIKNWNNPFQKSNSILSLSPGIAAPEDVQNDLMKAEDVGKKQLENVISTRIESNIVNFYEPIRKNQLKSFDSSKKRVLKVKGRSIAIKSDREIFARLLIIQGSRGVNLRDVLCFELSSVPLSIANPDGTISKTNKSKLFNSLEPLIPTVSNNIFTTTPNIFDGMVLLQKLPPSLLTFGDVSDYILKKLLKCACRVSFFVTDHYLPHSIKSIERERRSEIGLLRVVPSRRDQHKPKQFDKFLREASNQIDLIKFLVHDWSTNNIHVSSLENKELYVTCEQRAYCITASRDRVSSTPVPE